MGSKVVASLPKLKGDNLVHGWVRSPAQFAMAPVRPLSYLLTASRKPYQVPIAIDVELWLLV